MQHIGCENELCITRHGAAAVMLIACLASDRLFGFEYACSVLFRCCLYVSVLNISEVCRCIIMKWTWCAALIACGSLYQVQYLVKGETFVGIKL